MNSEALKPIVRAAKAIQDDATRLELELPPDEGRPSKGQMILPRSLGKHTPYYIAQVVEQVNSTYENGAYDACAVMIRRLTETLLIEAFERNGRDSQIKDTTGEFVQLGAIIQVALAEKWNLGRDSKRALPTLKELGDKSAHNRRFLTRRNDIDRIRDGLRVVVQELISISGLS